MQIFYIAPLQETYSEALSVQLRQEACRKKARDSGAASAV